MISDRVAAEIERVRCEGRDLLAAVYTAKDTAEFQKLGGVADGGIPGCFIALVRVPSVVEADGTATLVLNRGRRGLIRQEAFVGVPDVVLEGVPLEETAPMAPSGGRKPGHWSIL